MFYKKNLKTILSLIVFIVSICTFTMLQGFDLSDNQGHHSLKIIVNGPDGHNCRVTASPLSDPTKVFNLYKCGVNEYCTDDKLKTGDYLVRACSNSSPQGDGASIIVKVKDIVFNDNVETILALYHQHCLD